MAPRIGFTLLLIMAVPASAAIVDDNVYARLAREGAARVLIELAPGEGFGQRADLLRSVALEEVAVTHVLQTIPAVVASVTAAGLAQLAAHPSVANIAADREGSGGLATSVAQIRADRVRGRGLTGAGTIVAVLDSGIDAGHPDIAGALVGEECFCAGGCCPGRRARASGAGSAAGVHPHGVHVAGIVASRGRLAPIGVAPGTGLLAVRVLDDDNRGLLSDWLAALDWVAANRPDVRVVNMSLVSDALFTPPCDAADAFTRGFAQVTANLRSRGTIVVTAAGNDSSTTRLTAPGCVGNTITVGAVDATDRIADFSNRASGVDVVAPGVSVLSDAPNGTLGVLSGTSMAAAHVAGTLALLAEARPTSAEVLETTLRSTGTVVIDPRTRRTIARIDAFTALTTISRGAELLRGGGSRITDCLLEWSIVPPSIARDGRLPVVDCVDNDFLCDLDQQVGQCTFLLSACFNQNDPLLPDCPIDETITRFRLTSPAMDAPATSRERINADNLRQSLPGVPLSETNVCGVPFAFIVPVDRPAMIRASVHTPTRRDYDRVALRCR